MNEYLLKIKALVDALISVGNQVSTSEHIEAILEGLGEEYDPFICYVNSRLEPYTVGEIEALLLAQEVRFQKHIKISGSTKKVSVNVASTDIKDKSSGGRSNQSSTGGYREQNQGRVGRSYNRGRGRENRNGGRFVVCQLCNKPGHVAMNCCYRFDHNINFPNLELHLYNPSH